VTRYLLALGVGGQTRGRRWRHGGGWWHGGGWPSMVAWLLELIDGRGAFTVLSSDGDPWRMEAWRRSSSMAGVRRRPPAACSPRWRPSRRAPPQCPPPRIPLWRPARRALPQVAVILVGISARGREKEASRFCRQEVPGDDKVG
jgi:hypothetical protein